MTPQPYSNSATSRSLTFSFAHTDSSTPQHLTTISPDVLDPLNAFLLPTSQSRFKHSPQSICTLSF